MTNNAVQPTSLPIPGPASLDLDAYFARIGYGGPRAATLETLQAIVQHHTQTIPFENLNPFFRLPVKLDIESIQNKLVHSARGGYCFEQNGLLSQVLIALGFSIRPLGARVLWDAQPDFVRPRTHMILHVMVPSMAEEPMIADVGFGGNSPSGALRLMAGIEQETPHELFRLGKKDDDTFFLEIKLRETWKPLYRFDLVEQLMADYEMSNWYVCHHPDSHFISGISAARLEPGRRYALRNNQLSIHHTDGPSEQHLLTSVAELRDTLENRFGIAIPTEIDADSAMEKLFM